MFELVPRVRGCQAAKQQDHQGSLLSVGNLWGLPVLDLIGPTCIPFKISQPIPCRLSVSHVVSSLDHLVSMIDQPVL